MSNEQFLKEIVLTENWDKDDACPPVIYIYIQHDIQHKEIIFKIKYDSTEQYTRTQRLACLWEKYYQDKLMNP